MMIAIYANTLGSAYMTCQAEPCPYDDTMSDAMAVGVACAGDADCAALLDAIGDEPDQALLLSSGW